MLTPPDTPKSVQTSNDCTHDLLLGVFLTYDLYLLYYRKPGILEILFVKA